MEKLLTDNATISWDVSQERWQWALKLDAYNPIDVMIKEVRFRIGILVKASTLNLVTKEEFKEDYFDHFEQPDGNGLFIMKKGAVLSPGMWKSFVFKFSHVRKQIEAGDYVRAAIRTFSQDGTDDLHFTITAVKGEEE